MQICLDASAVIDWVLPQGTSQPRALDRFLLSATDVFAPPLIFAEFTATIRRLVHTNSLTAEQGAGFLQDLFALPIILLHNLDLYRRAFSLAGRLGHARAYDTQYLAAAQVTGAILLTADGGMHANANRLGISAQLVK
jgi:predicted nucleic acid-binding protein